MPQIKSREQRRDPGIELEKAIHSAIQSNPVQWMSLGVQEAASEAQVPCVGRFRSNQRPL